MATTKQAKASVDRSVRNAKQAVNRRQTNASRGIANVAAEAGGAISRAGAAVASRVRPGRTQPMTRAELYELAKRRDLPGRSKMTRDELARRLGER
jgi:hypothetical protein